MNSAVLPSTFVLTLLMGIGLFFFIRASAKDRTQSVQLLSDQPEESLLQQLQQYFDRRAYRVASVNAEQNQVVFEGFVRPSLFLAIFLTVLAAVGTLCLALVMAMLVSGFNPLWLGVVVVSPLAGVFYWRKAGRPEQVSLRIEAITLSQSAAPQSLITVSAHRDELAELQQALRLKPWESA